LQAKRQGGLAHAEHLRPHRALDRRELLAVDYPLGEQHELIIERALRGPDACACKQRATVALEREREWFQRDPD
jgi:hypothetical protein